MIWSSELSQASDSRGYRNEEGSPFPKPGPFLRSPSSWETRGQGPLGKSQQNLVLPSSFPPSSTWPPFMACQGEARNLREVSCELYDPITGSHSPP